MIAGAGSRGVLVPIREVWCVTVSRRHPNPLLQAKNSEFRFLVPVSACPTKEDAVKIPQALGYILEPKDFIISAIESAEIVDIPDAPISPQPDASPTTSVPTERGR